MPFGVNAASELEGHAHSAAVQVLVCVLFLIVGGSHHQTCRWLMFALLLQFLLFPSYFVPPILRLIPALPLPALLLFPQRVLPLSCARSSSSSVPSVLAISPNVLLSVPVFFL